MTHPSKPGILVVDDEQGVREVLGMALRLAGFPVWLAASGPESIKVFQGHAAEIGAVFLDVDMPGMDGPQTCLVLKQMEPGLRCFFMSGSGGLNQDQLRAVGAERFFSKPFELAEIVDFLLAGPASSSPPSL